MFELTQYALRTPHLADLPAEQYRSYHALAAGLLEAGASALHIEWSIPVPDLARLLVTLTDGLTLAWLADRDDAAADARHRPRRRRHRRRSPVSTAPARSDRVSAPAAAPAPVSAVRRAAQGGHRRLDRRLRHRLARHLDGAARPRAAAAARAGRRGARHRPTTGSQSVVAFGIISGIAGRLRADRLPAHRRALRPHDVAVRPPPPVDPRRRRCCSPSRSSSSACRPRYVGIGVWWSLALTGFCVLTAALTATISDQVPVGQRGFVSGWISAPQAIGTDPRPRCWSRAHHQPGFRLRRARRAAARARRPVPAHREGCGARRASSARSSTGAPSSRHVGPPAQAPRLRLDAAQPHPGQPRQRARHDAAAVLPRVRPARSTTPRTTSLLTLVYMVFVIIASLVLGRLSDTLGPPQAVRHVRRRCCRRSRRSCSRSCPSFPVALVARRAARPRLRLLPLRRPGARDPGAARRRRPRQGPRHHEHRHGRAAGGRPAARRASSSSLGGFTGLFLLVRARRRCSAPRRSLPIRSGAMTHADARTSPGRRGALARRPGRVLGRAHRGDRRPRHPARRDRPATRSRHNAHDMLDRARAPRSGWPASRCACAACSTPCSPCPATRACWPTRCPRRSGCAETRAIRMSWSATRRPTAPRSRRLAADAELAAARDGHGRRRRPARPDRRRGRPGEARRRSGSASSSTPRSTPRCSATSACAASPCTTPRAGARSGRGDRRAAPASRSSA